MDELTRAEVLDVLTEGVLEMEGLISWGSNYTFLVRACRDTSHVDAIYKPRKGERPLWDFTSGTLCLRERAAYLVSEALGWCFVPPTVLRDGPHGWGSVQRFVDHEPDQHYFTLQDRYRNQLQRIVLFDVLVNNADRKGGHVLLGKDDRLWSIDHGICFHAEHKLRTVIWDFAGMDVPESLLGDLRRFLKQLEDDDDATRQQLANLLNRREMEALRRRIAGVLEDKTFPHPGPGRHYPWPPV